MKTTTIIAMIITAAAATLLPHPPNFTPVAAIALFAGAQIADKRAAFAVPLGALFLRDLFVGLHILMPYVYASYAISVCLGFCLRRGQSAPRIALATLAGSVQFFLVTNFAVWAILKTFPQTPAGLVATYINGLPYFKNTLASDLLYSAILFGAFALAQRKLKTLPVHA